MSKNIIIQKLTSRKLWIAIFTFALFILNEQYNEALAVVLAYLGMQGVVDAVDTRKSGMVGYSGLENDMSQNVDTDKIVTGTGRTRAFDEENLEQ